jgi:hypothetical protein
MNDLGASNDAVWAEGMPCGVVYYIFYSADESPKIYVEHENHRERPLANLTRGATGSYR